MSSATLAVFITADQEGVGKLFLTPASPNHLLTTAAVTVGFLSWTVHDQAANLDLRIRLAISDHIRFLHGLLGISKRDSNCPFWNLWNQDTVMLFADRIASFARSLGVELDEELFGPFEYDESPLDDGDDQA